jgi:PIN domain nuclease of toxin-antitoxin system
MSAVVLDTSALLAGLHDEPGADVVLPPARVCGHVRGELVGAARLWSRTRKAGLSLGDSCCLALGARLGLTTITADTAWSDLDVDVDVRLIR